MNPTTLPIVHVALLVAVPHPPRDRAVHKGYHNLFFICYSSPTCVSAFLCIVDLKTEFAATNTVCVRIDIAVEAHVCGVRLAAALQLLDRLLRHRSHLRIVALVPLALVLYPAHVVASLHRIALAHHLSPPFPPCETQFPSARRIQRIRPASPSWPESAHHRPAATAECRP